MWHFAHIIQLYYESKITKLSLKNYYWQQDTLTFTLTLGGAVWGGSNLLLQGFDL